MACQEKNKIDTYYLGELAGKERKAFEDHIQTCTTCREAVQALLEIRSILNRRTLPKPPRHLAKTCKRTIEFSEKQTDAAPGIDKWYNRWVLSGQRIQWAAAVVIFCAGLIAGKVLFSPGIETHYSAVVKNTAQSRMDARQVRNYLLSVEMLLLDLSNLEHPAAMDRDEWAMQIQIAGEMLSRTDRVKQFEENRNPALYHLLVEIEWVLEDVVGTPSMDMADMATYIKGSIEENQLLSKLHHYIS